MNFNLSLKKSLYLILTFVMLGFFLLLFITFSSMNVQAKHTQLVQSLNNNNIELLSVQNDLFTFKESIKKASSKDEYEKLNKSLLSLEKKFKSTLAALPKNFNDKTKELNKISLKYFATLKELISIKTALGTEGGSFGALSELDKNGKTFTKKVGFLSAFVNKFEKVHSSGKSFLLQPTTKRAKSWDSAIKDLQNALVQMGFEGEFLNLLKKYQTTQKKVISLQTKYIKLDHNKEQEEKSLTDGIDKIVSLMQTTLKEAKETASSKASMQTYILVISSIIICLLMGVFIVFLTIMLNKKATSLIQEIEKIATGDLRGENPHSHSKDEFALLSIAVSKVVDSLKDLIKTAKDNSDVLAQTSNVLGQNVSNLESDVNVMVKDSENLVTTIQQVSSASKSSSDVCKEMEDVSQVALKTSVEGNEIISSTIDSIKDTSYLVDNINNKTIDLEEKSKEIDKVMEIITDIADQTGLLALNASIEAARVGAQGRGFAVVADEISKLAEETEGATKEINTIVSNIKQDINDMVEDASKAKNFVEKGDGLTIKAKQAITDIQTNTNATTTKATNVYNTLQDMSSMSTNMQEQTKNVNSLVVKQLDYSHSIVKISQELKQKSSELKASINKFKI